MITIIANGLDQDLAERAAALVAVDFTVRLLQDVAELPFARLETWCAMVVTRRITHATSHCLQRLTLSAPSVPRVLLVPRLLAVADAIGQRHCDAVIWSEDIERSLCTELRRVRAGNIRARVRVAAAMAPLDPLARRAIAGATRATRPLRSVTALAELLQCSRPTLWRAWRRCAGNPRARLEDVLDWLVLVAAVSQKTNRTSWASVAAQIGIHEDTLARIAMRLTGQGLRALDVDVGLLLSDDAVQRMLGSFFGDHFRNQFALN